MLKWNTNVAAQPMSFKELQMVDQLFANWKNLNQTDGVGKAYVENSVAKTIKGKVIRSFGLGFRLKSIWSKVRLVGNSFGRKFLWSKTRSDEN